MDFILAVIKPSYWLTHQNPVPEVWQLALTILFGTLLGVGILTALFSLKKSYRKPYRSALAKVGTAGIVLGIWGYAQLFLSVQRIGYLSARFFYLIWFAATVYWFYTIFVYVTKDIPRLKNQQDELAAKEKWLPKKKK